MALSSEFRIGKELALSLQAQIWKTFQAGCITPPSQLPTRTTPASLFQREHLWLNVLGEQLVQQAGCHIPLNFLNRADQWLSLTTGQQIQLLHKFYDWMVKEHVHLPEHQSLEQLLQTHAVPYDARALFPQYWGKDGATPNCLGLLMLTAHFARRTGSPFRVVNVIAMSGTLLSHFLGKLYAMAKPDLEQRYLVLDDDILEKMHRHIIRGQFPGLGISSFHHALALQLRDGRWYCLDPNTATRGFAPQSWSLDQQADDSPCAVLLAGSDRTGQTFGTRHVRMLAEAICHSRNLEEILSDLMDDWIAADQRERGGHIDPLAKLLNAVKGKEAWQFLECLHPANQRGAKLVKRLEKDRNDPQVRLMLSLFPGNRSPSKEDLIGAAELFRSSLAQREESIRHLLSRFHFWSISRYFSQLARLRPRLPHPWVEVNAHPYQAIGLFTTNSLRHARGWRASARYLHHSSSQLLAREVLHTGQLNPALRQQIVTALRSTPVLHPLVQHTLEREM